MSLREDLEIISVKEGFKEINEFIEDFIIKRNKTFKDLTQYLENSYRRFYSWGWVYIYCHKFIPDYRISKRKRDIDESGCYENKGYWNDKATVVGYSNLDGIFRDYQGSIASLARLMDVRYTTLYARYQAWRKHNNVK
jgi:hypothetical protein